MISAARLGIGCAPSMRHAATCRLLGFVSQTWRGTRRFEELTRCAFAASSYVCARMYSYYILIHVFQTRSHTTRPPRPVARSYRTAYARTRARMRRVLSVRTGYIPTHRLSAAWKSSHTVKTHFPRRRRTVLDLAELMWSAGRYGCTRPRGPQRAALPDH